VGRNPLNTLLQMNLAQHGDWLMGQEDRRLSFRNIDVSVDVGAARIAVTGEIDIADAEALRELLVEAAAEAREVEVDLRGVRFVDSAGCRALVQSAEQARSAGGRIRVVVAEGPVRRVLQLLDVEDLLCGSE
jgi:anti-sigma B factor antagonist